MITSYNSTINITARGLGDSKKRAVSIHDYYDIDLGYTASFACDGNRIGDNFKTCGPVYVPAYNRVTRVRINFEWSTVDDHAILEVSNLRLESPSVPDWGGDNGSGPGSMNGIYNVRLSSSNVYIYAGVRNTKPTTCMLRDGYIRITFLYN